MSSNEIIDGLLTNQNWAFESFYKENYDTVKRYVMRNSGTADDAKDIFQETTIALIKMITKSDFQLNPDTKLSTLVYSIASRLWLMSLRKKKIPVSSIDVSDLNYDFTSDQESLLEEKVEYEKKHYLIAKCLKTMGTECQKLLDLYYFKNVKLKDIAGKLSYSDGFVRVKKNRCMNTLRAKVKEMTTDSN